MKERSRRTITRRSLLRDTLIGAGSLSVLPLLQACQPSAGPATQPESSDGADTQLSGAITIGLLLPFSGPFTTLGEDQVRGAELYLEQQGGSFSGMSVEFVREDTQGDPSVGLQKAQRLVESSGVDITAGIISSAVALAVRDYFHNSENLLVISNASANAVTGDQFSPYIFRVSVSSWQNSFPLGAWAYENVGSASLQLIPDYAAGHELAAGFEEGFINAGGTVVDVVSAPLGTTDYGPFLSGVNQAGADFVWSAMAGSDALNLVQQYEQFGLKDALPLIGVGSLTSEDVLQAQGPAALGIRSNYPYAPTLDNSVNEAFVADYREKYDANPSPFSMWGYDAIQFIHQALLISGGSTDVTSLIEAMEQTQFESPRGPVSFDAETHNVVQQQYLLEVQETEDGFVNVPVEVLGTYSDREQIS